MSTNISWTDETWNPVTGCSRVSEGCRNCYAARQAPRLAAMGQKGYTALPWTAKNAPENVMVHEDRLEKPLRWKKPRRVFVNSMSDLFHEQVPDAFIDKVFAVMALAPQHTFQILTKRPERMAEYISDERRPGRIRMAAQEWPQGGTYLRPVYLPWPITNIWLGTSVEDQRAADERIPHLMRTPAAVRFLSCEPLVGPVDLSWVHDCGPGVYYLRGGRNLRIDKPGWLNALQGIDWVIAGGESGPGFRPMDPDWPRSLRDQCDKAGVPFFFKQSSGLRPEKNALLDGEEWRQFPEER